MRWRASTQATLAPFGQRSSLFERLRVEMCVMVRESLCLGCALISTYLITVLEISACTVHSHGSARITHSFEHT